MNLKKSCTLLVAIVCCVAVNAGDAYQKAHREWLQAREKYYIYCKTQYAPGIALAKQEKELKEQVAKRKVELYQMDPKLKPLYDKLLIAEKAYKASPKARDKKNRLTMAKRALESAWRSSEARQDKQLVELQQKIKKLSWRDVYVEARSKDSEALKLYKAYREKAKIMDEAKKGTK